MNHTPGKLSAPYIPKSCIVRENRETMIIAKRGDPTVTRNKAQFKTEPDTIKPDNADHQEDILLDEPKSDEPMSNNDS